MLLMPTSDFSYFHSGLIGVVPWELRVTLTVFHLNLQATSFYFLSQYLLRPSRSAWPRGIYICSLQVWGLMSLDNLTQKPQPPSFQMNFLEGILFASWRYHWHTDPVDCDLLNTPSYWLFLCPCLTLSSHSLMLLGLSSKWIPFQWPCLRPCFWKNPNKEES